MKTRVVHTRFWKDSYINTLSVTEKLLFIFLLTNDCINMCGIYELSDKYICLDCGISLEELNTIKDKFTKDNKFIFYNGWVKVINHNKFNSYGKGEWQKKALDKELLLVPSHLLDTSIDTSIYTTINNKYKTINNKQEIINNKDELNFKEILQRKKLNLDKC